MKNKYFILQVILILILSPSFAYGQRLVDEASINLQRKGTIIVEAPKKSMVTIEQVSHEFWFGCAIGNGPFSGYMQERDVEMFKEKFLENFNSAVTENAVKWGNMERRRGEVDYNVVDGILAWTEENDIPLRAHNLFWGIPKYVQPWLKELSDEELEQVLKERAITVTSRYKGRFAEYDLNNEMIHGNYYEERLGPDITMQMARWAHQGDPGIKLYLNDYDILTGRKLPEYLTHIRQLKSQGVPINGIGVQGHLHGEEFDRQALKDALDSLAQFGLPIRITEFNMPGQRSIFMQDRSLRLSPDAAKVNARELTDYYTICFAHPAVEGILMWGFWEGANWIPASSMYDRDWNLTETGKAYKKLVFNDWWTNELVKTGRKGKVEVPAFYGKYQVTVDGETREVELKKSEGIVRVNFL